MRGRYFSGDNAIARDVDVQLAREGLRIGFGDGKQMLWPWARVRVETDGHTSLNLLGPQGTLMEVFGSDLEMKPLRDRLHLSPVGSLMWWHWGLLGAGCVSLLTALFLLSNPFSQLLARHVPMEWEYKMGATLGLQLDKFRCETPQQAQILQRLTWRMLRHRLTDEEAPLQVEVHLTNMDMVNAFTLPGGVIVVDTKLLDLLHEPEELAAVLGHEVEHARLRHVMAAVIRGAFLSALWSVSVGDYSSIVVVDPSTLLRLARLRFDRQAEHEADLGALGMLVDAHINPRAAGVMFKRLPGVSEAQELFESHPSNEGRVALFNDAATDVTDAWGPPLTAQEWELLKVGCEVEP